MFDALCIKILIKKAVYGSQPSIKSLLQMQNSVLDK